MNSDSSQARRHLLRTAAACALSSALPAFAAGDPPPETKRIRLPRLTVDVACVSPMWIGEELLRGEGFEQIQYVEMAQARQIPALVAGEIDLDIRAPFAVLLALDAGKPLVVLSGIHGGCYELFGTNGVRTIRDLKGKTIGVPEIGRQAFVSMMLDHVGLDARKDVTFIDTSATGGVRLLADGKIDAYLGFPPEPQQIRAQKIAAASLVNTAIDRPWSQYFCCSVIGNREFVAKYPVATKRALRALLKAADICAADPAGTARKLVDRGFVSDYASSAQALGEIPYSRWREYDSADTQRFYALRLHEAGAIKSDPKKLLAQGTDWRFIRELKKELKA
jgi:NitT/TauT family transport system substrate-binding protein